MSTTHRHFVAPASSPAAACAMALQDWAAYAVDSGTKRLHALTAKSRGRES